MTIGKNNVNFYSTIGGSVQRLPNGNTFVCSMNDGHLFEVAPTDTSVVWEYINPITRDGIKKIKVSETLREIKDEKIKNKKVKIEVAK